MKNLKAKFGFFSPLALLAISVFMTSCEQENIINETPIEEVSLLEIDSEIIESEFILPYGYDQLSQEELNDYFSSLDNEKFTELVNSKKIRDYFFATGKESLLMENVDYGQVLGNDKLELLSSSEILEFQSFNADDYLESRNCTSWTTTGTVEKRVWTHCRKYDYQTRSCNQFSLGCFGFCSTSRLRNPRDC